MNVTLTPRFVTTATLLALVGLSARESGAQQPATPPAVVRLSSEPASLSLEVGQTASVTVTAWDAQGRPVPEARPRLTAPRRSLVVSQGQVRALAAGSFEIVASVPTADAAAPVTLRIPVRVTWPAIRSVTVTTEPGRLYAGVTLPHRSLALHADGAARPAEAVAIRWRTSNPAVATVDRFGNVTAHRPGAVTVTAEAEGVTGSRSHAVAANPVAGLTITSPSADTTIRTGDVVHLVAAARTRAGQSVTDVPITWSYSYVPDDTIAAPGATGIIDRGMFAAEVPGRYTLLAAAGNVLARSVVEVEPRDVRRRISVTGRGSITHVHTSDLWPWTGRDGRDYALVGTWGGDGWAYVMDITDLTNIVRTDSIRVDARVINDVTVSPDGRYGALSREGASNRVNGVVILDLSNPAHPTVASTFEQGLTGGVHNMFATNDHLFAISNGDKYVIIDVRDLRNPRYAGEYDHPNSRVHDVWVRDGIAYSSEWGTGVVAVDVGNGRWGGSIERPVLIAAYPTTSGATHEIFPYVQRSTGKVYLFLGDEIMSRQGRVWEGTNYLQNINARGGVPQTSAGYTHIIDFTDPANPRNVASYHHEEFGTHDIIVEDDVLYQAYYDGGLRVVDVSGELLGSLAEQRREIAVYKPFDPQGYTANAPFVMNAMPWKGHILFTDFNSGLWSARLEPRRPLVP
jgi:uncharacterized protein YjdB